MITPPAATRVYRDWPALTGLRGIAVALVIVNHMGLIALDVSAGAIGVTLFFVLSGLLITSIIVQAQTEGRWSFAQFFMNRAIRLLPALLLVEAVVVIWWYVDRGVDHGVWKYVASSTFYLEDFFHPLFKGGPLGPTWSLAVEEQFYLVWPLLVAPLLRLQPRTRWLFIAVGTGLSIVLRLGIAVLGYIDFAYANIVTVAFALLLGCALALSRFELPTALRPVAVWGGLAAMVGLVAVSGFAPQPFITMPVIAAFVSAGIILGALGGSAVLESAPLAFLGRISYSLYLWHWPLLYFTDQHGAGWSALPMMLLSLVLATASTFLLEEPLRRAWRKRQTFRTETPAPLHRG